MKFNKHRCDMEAEQRVSFSQPVGARGSWISLD